MKEKPEVLKKIAKNLKRIRRENGFSQVKVSRELEIDHRGYQRYERPDQIRDLRITTLVKFLDYYKIKFEELTK